MSKHHEHTHLCLSCLVARLGRATRGGLLAGALLGLAAGGMTACSDSTSGKTDTIKVADGANEAAASDAARESAAADSGVDMADAAAGDTTHDVPQLPPYGIAPVIIDQLA
ncbi:MAG: hypothetical protein KC503_20595 [Myxococcales bacterium]|nr:hypothetical protein [Myxococcales bacterium]